MNRICKLLVSALIIIGLLAIGMIPTFAYGSYGTTRTYYYYSNGNYNCYVPGSYSTKYGAYKPITPTQPVVKPPVTPQPPVPPTKPPATPAPVPTPAPLPTTGLSGEESKMVNLVNQERLSNALKPFSVNMQLVNLARMKSQDMVKNNYFGHTSPTYGSPFDMMNKAGVKYSTAGENLAGAATTESAHQNLMNSPGHRANILNPSFNQIGIGIATGSVYGSIFTQMFIGN